MKRATTTLKNYNQRIIIKLYDKVSFSPPPNGKLEEYLQKTKLLPWKAISGKYPGIVIKKVFTSLPAEKLNELVKKAKEKNPNYKAVNLNYYLAISCPKKANRNKLFEEIRKIKTIEKAYLEGIPAQPHAVTTARNPRAIDQGHLDPAPLGINARHAWNRPGGKGLATVKFIDVEKGWILSHEDLPSLSGPNGIKIESGKNKQPKTHGTSVLGIIMAQDNTVGGLGIVPSANASVVSSIRSNEIVNDRLDYNVADAVSCAVRLLDTGDVLLIEEQFQDPINNAYMPCETDEAVFRIISTATSIGIIVIEPAANGSFDLDTYKQNGKFIFKRLSEANPPPGFIDSGAIMVGAGTSDVPHVRESASNFGSRIDCFAWGENIVTAGSRRESYTSFFSGTSGASAIIAGAAIAVQSLYQAKTKQKLNAGQMRKLLSDKRNGTPTATGADMINVMPDLLIIDGLIQAGQADSGS